MSALDEDGWTALVAHASAGELYLEAGVAQACAARCDDLIRLLDGILSDAMGLTTVVGFGDRLPSGIALAAKFERKASGGDYALDDALADHIKEVQKMRDVFLAIENRYAATEEANTAAAGAVEPHIN
ncbi:hypothetical protein [Prescottella equi]|uniref:hypothetical protein n=1 Tax=Rhodococcus hoagii TaxID=43767 RepID=UPI001EEB21A0|nr:hypothetical protein [Prescottella equi]